MSDEKYRPRTFEEALAHFVEECGEALAAAGKTQRFGPLSTNPELPLSHRETNAEWLRREVIDLMMAVETLKPYLNEPRARW